VLDNFSPHKHPNVRAWVAANQVKLVYLPAYGSSAPVTATTANRTPP
jgi:hypothetical protein